LGALGGGTVAVVAASDCYECYDRLFLGLLVGEVAGSTIGAHAGNRQRGSFGKTLLVSTGILAAGVMVQGAGGGGVGGAVFILPIQVLTVTAVQVRTSPHISVGPVLQRAADGFKAGITIRW
jgi:hypothetical protein